MTLEQFQASKTWSDDLGAVLADCAWHGEPPGKGWVYLGALYIEQVQAHWPPQARAAGHWHLLIGRAEWISDDLPSLEQRLYDFAVSEGFTEGETLPEQFMKLVSGNPRFREAKKSGKAFVIGGARPSPPKEGPMTTLKGVLVHAIRAAKSEGQDLYRGRRGRGGQARQ